MVSKDLSSQDYWMCIIHVELPFISETYFILHIYACGNKRIYGRKKILIGEEGVN